MPSYRNQVSLSSGTLIQGNNLDVMHSMSSAGELFDGCVTDPPYLMDHMREWDSKKAAGDPVKFHMDWMSAVRAVLKPGAFLLSCASGRTYHWQAEAAESLGFIIHSPLTWIRIDTMPKGTDFLKQLHRREIGIWAAQIPGVSREDLRSIISAATNPEWADKEGEKLPKRKAGMRLIEKHKKAHGNPPMLPDSYAHFNGARYGTQTLKPAVEMLLMAQKPYDGKPLDSIKKHGCGALFVLDAHTADDKFPANCVITGLSLQEAVNAQGDWVRQFYIGDHDIDFIRHVVIPTASAKERDMGLAGTEKKAAGGMAGRENGSFDGHMVMRHNFSVAVKPISLMAWASRLTIPPKGVILDPFAGSGTTAIGAHKAGRRWTCIEENADIFDIATKRLQYWTDNQPDLV